MSDSRRLLCVYPWLVLGGSDKFNLDMLACLGARGWRSTIVTTLPSTHPWRAAFEPLSDDIVDLTAYPVEEYPARLLALISTRAIDSVLISNSLLGYRLLPYLRAQFPHLTYVDYCHAEQPEWHNGGYPRMSLTYAHALDLQIVASRALKRWMCARGGEDARIAVCPINIDAQSWDAARHDRQALRSALGLAPAAPVVLYAARLDRNKQPALALSVMREIARRMPDVSFLVAGDGQFAGYMHSFLRWYGLEQRVRMLGAVSSQRMAELLAISDVFFLPSQMEGISLAIYEAMAMGVVPLAADVGGQRELVTPECGVLIARGPNERAAYRDALLDLLGDPRRLQQLGQAARRRVATHFRLEQMGERMHELLIQAQALHQHNPRPPIRADAALAAARDTIAVTRREEDELRRYTTGGTTPRQRLRALYWSLVERGAWWLVPLAERAWQRSQPPRDRDSIV